MKRPLVLGAVGVLGVLAALALVAGRDYVRGVRGCHPTRVALTDADRASATRALPKIEAVAFRADDGVTLRGFYVPPKNGVVVVMAHGLGENRMRFLPDAEMLVENGYGVLFFDSRAHGESDGEASTWGGREQLDVRAAIDFATARAGARSVASLGFSIGASAVALEAANDPRVRAVILEAIWPTLEEEIRDKAPRVFQAWPTMLGMRHAGVVFDDVRPIDTIGQVAPRALLFLGGSLERDTPPDVLERVFARAGDPKRLWIVPGADHGTYFATQPEAYRRRITTFLQEVFFPR